MKTKYQEDSISPRFVPEIVTSISGEVQLIQETKDGDCWIIISWGYFFIKCIPRKKPNISRQHFHLGCL